MRPIGVAVVEARRVVTASARGRPLLGWLFLSTVSSDIVDEAPIKLAKPDSEGCRSSRLVSIDSPVMSLLAPLNCHDSLGHHGVVRPGPREVRLSG